MFHNRRMQSLIGRSPFLRLEGCYRIVTCPRKTMLRALVDIYSSISAALSELKTTVAVKQVIGLSSLVYTSARTVYLPWRDD